MKKKNLKVLKWILVITLIILLFLIFYFVFTLNFFNDTSRENNLSNQNNLSENSKILKCKYNCMPVTQGALLEENVLEVCGCIPVCSQGEVLVASATDEVLANGKIKGVFACFSSDQNLPPSVN